MKKIKILAFILALCLLLPTFIACGDEEGEESQTTQEAVDTSEEKLPHNVEQEDNGGKVFNIIKPKSNTIDDITEETTGSVTGQALYKADLNVEQHLGINIEYINVDGDWNNRASFNGKLLAAAMGGDKSEYDLIMAETSAAYASSLQNGLVLDLSGVKTIDLDAPWYLANMVDTYGINGKLFGARSDASMTTYETLALIFFNEKTVSENRLENPYDLVREDKWTAEKMFEMALSIGSDSNGNGIPGELDADNFGYIGHHVASRGYMTAFNVVIAERDANDGNMRLKSTADEMLVNKWQYMFDKFENNSDVLLVPTSENAAKGVEAFKTGRSLFYNGFFSHATDLRDTAWDWGIVPMPKYDENQERYYSPAGTQAMMFMIMINAEDVELSGKVLELKSYFNYYDVSPVYCEQVLGYQFGRSPEHMEMLDLIRETSTLSFMAAMNSTLTPDPYNIFQMDTLFRNTRLNGSVTTWYETNIMAWNNQLEKIYKALK